MGMFLTLVALASRSLLAIHSLQRVAVRSGLISANLGTECAAEIEFAQTANRFAGERIALAVWITERSEGLRPQPQVQDPPALVQVAAQLRSVQRGEGLMPMRVTAQNHSIALHLPRLFPTEIQLPGEG
jgi:hypothetical protein